MPANHLSTCLEIRTHVKVNEVAPKLGVDPVFMVAGFGETHCLKLSSFVFNEWKSDSGMRFFMKQTKKKKLKLLKCKKVEMKKEII